MNAACEKSNKSTDAPTPKLTHRQRMNESAVNAVVLNLISEHMISTGKLSADGLGGFV